MMGFQVSKNTSKTNARNNMAGSGGEIHQTAHAPEQSLTTNQGTRIADNQNSLKWGARATFLMVFLIQNSQNRASAAIQVKNNSRSLII
jgi:catalase